MPIINPTLPTVGAGRGSEEVDGLNVLTALLNLVNGNIDDANIAAAGLSGDSLTSAVVQALGLSDSGAVRRGKSIIATEETRTNAVFGLMPTPDRVQNLVLPTDGLICVAYHALAKCTTVNGAGAIFIGANQLKAATSGVPSAQAATISNASYDTLSTAPVGLVLAGVAASSVVTTGQAVNSSQTLGGACLIFAAAGTYDVSVQFAASPSGTVSAMLRKLWVWTLGF